MANPTLYGHFAEALTRLHESDSPFDPAGLRQFESEVGERQHPSRVSDRLVGFSEFAGRGSDRIPTTVSVGFAYTTPNGTLYRGEANSTLGEVLQPTGQGDLDAGVAETRSRTVTVTDVVFEALNDLLLHIYDLRPSDS